MKNNFFNSERSPERMIKAFGISQAIWGADSPDTIYFATAEERNRYYNDPDNDHCSKLAWCKRPESMVYPTYDAYLGLGNR
ncbi:MAG: hypothetical protein ACK5L3_07515 [Oscillospiraceae bacterium]